MRGIAGLLVMALMVLAIIWAYNKFSGKSIAALGAPSTAAS
jgi:hypothetical protein